MDYVGPDGHQQAQAGGGGTGLPGDHCGVLGGRDFQGRPRAPHMNWTRHSAGADIAPTVLTVGHSTRTIQQFIHLLQVHGVTRVVDVRTIPRSRHNPQFNVDCLPGSLGEGGVGYVHLAGLGGLRHARRDSPNTGWRNASFRGFADYMQTPAFEEALTELIHQATTDRIALMCAEAVPWGCHRSLIADALLARGIRAEHIMSTTRCQPHTLTPFAKVQGARVTYPAEGPQEPGPEPSRLQHSMTTESGGHVERPAGD